MYFRKICDFIKVLTSVRKSEGQVINAASEIPVLRGRKKVFKRKVVKLTFISSLTLTSKILAQRRMDPPGSSATVGLPVPPDTVRGMKCLDRSQFEMSVFIPTLKVPKPKINQFMKNKVLSKAWLKSRGIPSIVDAPDPNAQYKIVLLNPEKFNSPNDIDTAITSELENLGVSCELDSIPVTLNYDHWNHRDILNAILPVNTQGVSGFSQIGHIVHLNLKDELLEYKKIIGEVILDKVKTARTVVNKMGIIDNTFRNFQMEVIAGEEDFVAVTNECGATYQLDFSKVYWNPRLGFEHENIVALLQPGDCVFDMFAGIGPFAIPAAKKKCTVFANDLNPESYKWLKENIERNKVDSRVSSYNLDGRDFAKNVIAQELPKIAEAASEGKTVHIIMNLPAIALEFTDIFPGLLATSNCQAITSESGNGVPVKVYCHCFSKDKEAEADIRQRLEQSMGSENVPEFEAKYVRNVAPAKEMFRVMFELSWSLLTGPQILSNEEKKVPSDVGVTESKSSDLETDVKGTSNQRVVDDLGESKKVNCDSSSNRMEVGDLQSSENNMCSHNLTEKVVDHQPPDKKLKTQL